MVEVVVTTRAISRAKLQSNRHHQQTITHLGFRSKLLLEDHVCRLVACAFARAGHFVTQFIVKQTYATVHNWKSVVTDNIRAVRKLL